MCAVAGWRFAFYGRTSTAEHQDPVTSAVWQRESAEELVAGHGVVVAHYFDVGKSRGVPWRDRRGCGAGCCGHCAIRIGGSTRSWWGEYERAFAGEELAWLLPLFCRYGVQVWLPEATGPVDPETPEHRALMTILSDPRCTGWQVWGCHTTERGDAAPVERRRGRLVRRTAARKNRVVSDAPAHAALVSEHAFVAVQRLRTARPPRDGTAHVCRLAGYVRCRPWRTPQWTPTGHTAVLATAAATSAAVPNGGGTAGTKALYMREDEPLIELAALLHPDGEYPALSRRDLVAELRARDQVIVCDVDQLFLAARHPARMPVETTNPTGMLW